MFYRFKPRLATQDRFNVFPVPIPDSDLDPWGPWFTEYDEKFKCLAKKQVGPNAFIELNQAPEFGEKTYGVGLYFAGAIEPDNLPDCWGVAQYTIVSDRFRRVLEGYDDMPHEFWAVQLMDNNWKVLQTDQKYYWLNLKRFLTIRTHKEFEENVGRPNLNFFPDPVDEEFVYSLGSDSNLSKELEQYPIWRPYLLGGAEGFYSQSRTVLYFNSDLFEALTKENIVGLTVHADVRDDAEATVVRL